MSKSMLTTLRTKLKTEDGATATEYVLLLIGVALLVIFGALFLGNALDDNLSSVAEYVSGAEIPGT